MSRRIGTHNKSIRFFPSKWQEAVDGLSRAERSVLFEVALYTWQQRQPCPFPVLAMMLHEREDRAVFEGLIDSGHILRVGDRFLARIVLEMKKRSTTGRIAGEEWAAIRSRIFARDDYTCRYCSKRGGKLECDHVFPVSLGGGDEDDNLVTACKPCNRAKGARTLEQMGWAI